MVAPVATNGEDEMSEATDFDFLQGEWNSRQRRRREWLAGSDEWDEFEATIAARPILDGLGTVEGVSHRLRRRLRRRHVPLLRPGESAMVDLLGRHALSRAAARPAGHRLVLR
jgi:hypothetical protein